MFTIANYFDTVKDIPYAALPDNLKKGYEFVQITTQNYKTWHTYHHVKEIGATIDRYLKSLNAFLGRSENKQTTIKETAKEKKEKITPALAKEKAKELIQYYVNRGDTLESLMKSSLGIANGSLTANIRGKNILISAIDRQKVNFSFPLKTIYNELQKKPSNHEANTQTSRQTPPAHKKSEGNPHKTNLPPAPRIDYSDSRPVERIGEDVKFIKRFLALHGKSRTKEQILNFLNALQRAILEKRIHKTSAYSKEIMQIQKQLVSAHRIMKASQVFEIGESSRNRFAKIIGSYRVRPSIQFIKRFVSIQGKHITKQKAKALMDSIQRSVTHLKLSNNDPYHRQIVNVLNALNEFVDTAKQGETLHIHEQVLNGLNGVLGCAEGCACHTKKKDKGLNGMETEMETGVTTKALPPPDHQTVPESMTVQQAKEREYQTVNLPLSWRELLGDICLPTHFFAYGNGGSGKTSFALLFSQLMERLGYRVLYIAGEQYDTPPFKHLLILLNIVGGKNFQIVANLKSLQPEDFDLIVLDTKDSLDIETEEFEQLKEDYPKQSFFVVSHSLKDGDYKGKGQWRNIVDVMVYGENGVIYTGIDKNRWGGKGSMAIFDHDSQYIFKKGE